MSRSLRLVVVGTGQIADSHVPAALAAPGVEITALVDPAEDRARALAERWSLAARVTSRLGDALEGADAALIATPNDTHAALALECIAARVPVLVEKPLATSLADGERVVSAAEAAGVPLAVGFSTRFQWNVQFARELLRSGRLGRVRRFAYQFGHPGGWSSYTGYHLRRASVGGGVLVTTGTHFLDRMIDWFGYPTHAELEDDSLGGPEANALARFEFAAGNEVVTGSARFSRTVRLTAGIAIETDEGIATLREDQTSTVAFRSHASPEVTSELKPTAAAGDAQKSIFLLQLEDFAATCRGEHAPLVSGRQALASLRLCEALYANRRELRTDPYYVHTPRAA
jgi:predicted dehydrogenase